MKLPIKERTFTTAMIILATIVVIVLGALQYRWSNQISEATSIRLADSLQMSMINWHLDFFRDFSEICIAMRVDPEVDAQDDWEQYARRFAEWKKTAAHPELVSAVYVLKPEEFRGPGALQPNAGALTLDPATMRFAAGDLSPNLSALSQELLAANSQDVAAGAPDPMTAMANPNSQASDR